MRVRYALPALAAACCAARHVACATPSAAARPVPQGRELRRNWQRQIILETKALDATRARCVAGPGRRRQLLLPWLPLAPARLVPGEEGFG